MLKWNPSVLTTLQASSLVAGVDTLSQSPWLWSSGWQTSVSELNSCSRSRRELPVGVQRNWRYCWLNRFFTRLKLFICTPWRNSYFPSRILQNIHVCLGSLFVPEAYITATRQYVAQANSWSLEELCLEVNVTTAQGASLDACSFGIKGWTKQYIICRKQDSVTMINSGSICK